MKKILILMLLLPLLTFAQESVTSEVTATILTQLSLTKDADIAFGNLSGTSTPILDPTGVSHTDVGTQATVGEFTVAGAANAQISVSYDASVTLGDGTTNTITYTPSVAGHATTQTSATAITNGSQVTIDSNGDYKIWVGGNLGTLTSQTAGSYSSAASNGSGNFTLSIEYY